MSEFKYCAVGDYGIEFVADTLANVESWIGEQVADEDLPEDYYSIVTHTQAELDDMPED